LSHSIGPGQILTTEWILTELADAMASRIRRPGFVSIYHLLRSDDNVEIVPVSQRLFVR
jgi:hypothetical protein